MRGSLLLFVWVIACFLMSFFRMQEPIEGNLSSIQKNIFDLKCANPACHGGAFEPNLSDAFTSWYSLVWYPVTKNNAEKSFRYRVVPYDTAKSQLHERVTNCCFVNPNDRMPQSRIGTGLEADEIIAIEKWILAGAPDPFGKVHSETVFSQTQIKKTFALQSTSSGKILSDSSLREGHLAYGHILLKRNENFSIRFDILNPKTEIISLEFSPDPDFPEEKTKRIEALRQGDNPVFPVNANSLSGASIWYFRVYSNVDGANFAYPSAESPQFEKQTWSLKFIP